MLEVFISVLDEVVTDRFSGQAANALVTDLKTGEKSGRFVFDFKDSPVVTGTYLVGTTEKGALKILGRDLTKSLEHDVAAKAAMKDFAALKKSMGL